MKNFAIFTRFPQSGRWVFALYATLALVGTVGCANRGMQSPKDGAAGGSGGGGGAGAAGGIDGSFDLTGDGSDDRSTNCPARFNFENSALYGATINSSHKAFTTISNSGVQTLCGFGALEIDATFMGSTGDYTAGEVDIPLNGTEDLSGKTLTVNARMEGSGSVSFFVLLTTSTTGYQTVPGYPLRLTNSQWSTGSYFFPSLTPPPTDGGTDGGPRDGGAADAGLPDGGVLGQNGVYGLALEAFSFPGADAATTTKIYVDEIDIK